MSSDHFYFKTEILLQQNQPTCQHHLPGAAAVLFITESEDKLGSGWPQEHDDADDGPSAKAFSTTSHKQSTHYPRTNRFLYFLINKQFKPTKVHQSPSKSIKLHQNPTNFIKLHQNPSKSTKVHQNPTKSIKLHQNPSKPIKAHQNPSNPSKSTKVHQNPTNFNKIHQIPSNSIKVHQNTSKSIKIHQSPSNPSETAVLLTIFAKSATWSLRVLGMQNRKHSR